MGDEEKLYFSKFRAGGQDYEVKDAEARAAIESIQQTLTGGIIQTVNGLSGTDITLNGSNIAIDGTTGTSIADYINTRDEVISAALNDLNSAISGSNYEADQISGTITSLSGTVNNLSGTVTNLSGTVNTVSGNVTNLSGTVNNLSGTVTNLSGTVDTLSGNVTNLSGTVNNLSGTVTNLSGTVDTLSGNVTNLSGTVTDLSGTVYGLNYTDTPVAGQFVTEVNQENGVVTVERAGITSSQVSRTGTTGLSGTTVEEALTQLADLTSQFKAGAGITLTSTGPTGSNALVYTLTQGTTTIGTINIPKDLVVSSGSVVTAGDGEGGTVVVTGATAGDKYIRLIIANQAEPIDVNVKDLVDIYTVATGATEVQLALSNSNELSAELVSGGVGKTKLASGVQTSLDKADTAIQTINGIPADKTGFTGAVQLYGTDVPISSATGGTSITQAITGAQADITAIKGATVITSISYLTGSETIEFLSGTIGSLIPTA